MRKFNLKSKELNQKGGSIINAEALIWIQYN